MAVDITLEAKEIKSIEITGYGRTANLEIRLSDAELAESVDVHTIVEEYISEELLEAIGTELIKKWLEGQGFTVTYGDAL